MANSWYDLKSERMEVGENLTNCADGIDMGPDIKTLIEDICWIFCGTMPYETDWEMLIRKMANLVDARTKEKSMDQTGARPYYKGTISLNSNVPGCLKCGFPFGNYFRRREISYCPNCGRRIIWMGDEGYDD